MSVSLMSDTVCEPNVCKAWQITGWEGVSVSAEPLTLRPLRLPTATKANIIELSRKIWITPNQHPEMEYFDFSIDFHHSMFFFWIRKAKLKSRKMNYFAFHHLGLISVCSGRSQIGHPLLSYLGLIHIQAYSQPYLDKIQNIIRGLRHC